MKTLQEVMIDIQEIINNTQEEETRLQALQAKGFKVESCCVKNGDIGRICYKRRKNVYRIQITKSKFQGNHHKAFCVVISFYDLSIQISETTRMITIPVSKKARKELQKSGF
jgi:hypothetical protein